MAAGLVRRGVTADAVCLGGFGEADTVLLGVSKVGGNGLGEGGIKGIQSSRREKTNDV